jgi:hypothetical protein
LLWRLYGGGYHHNDININTGDINIGNNVNIGNRDKMQNKLSNKERKNNLYNNDSNRLRNADRATVKNNRQLAKNNPTRKNNLYADRNGQVARREADQWQVRKDNQWSNVSHDKTGSRDIARKPQTRDIQPQRPAQRPQVDRRSQFDHHSMNRDFHARARGGGGMNRRRR